MNHNISHLYTAPESSSSGTKHEQTERWPREQVLTCQWRDNSIISIENLLCLWLFVLCYWFWRWEWLQIHPWKLHVETMTSWPAVGPLGPAAVAVFWMWSIGRRAWRICRALWATRATFYGASQLAASPTTGSGRIIKWGNQEKIACFVWVWGDDSTVIDIHELWWVGKCWSHQALVGDDRRWTSICQPVVPTGFSGV